MKNGRTICVVYFYVQFISAIFGGATSFAQSSKSYKLLYGCDLIKDAAIIAEIESIDDRLNVLLIKTTQLRSAYQRLIRACESLDGKSLQGGPKMDLFRIRSYELGILKGRLTDLSDALSAPGVIEEFATVQNKIKRDQESICRDEIKYVRGELLKQAEATLDAANLDCGSVQ